MKETIKTLIEVFWEGRKYGMYDYRLDRYLYRMENNKEPSKLFFLKWVWSFVNRAIKIIMCGFLGHKWHDYGIATPDYGYIDMCCDRCGFSHGIVNLY